MIQKATLTDRWFQMKPVPQVQQILLSQARWIRIRSGRRAYKTEVCKRKLVIALSEDVGWKNPAYFYAAPTRKQAKKIAWEDLKQLVPKHWLDGKPSETELLIRTKFGSTLEVVGLDSPERIEGGGFNGGVVDERSDVKPRAIDISILPALADRDGWLIESGVPKRQGKGARSFNDGFSDALSANDPDSECYAWPSSMVLTEDQLGLFRARMDDKDYREQFEADIVMAGGSVFYNWSSDNVRPIDYHPDLPLIVGMDFNVDPMCWVMGHDISKELCIVDELWKRDTNTEHSLNALWKKYKHHKGGFIFYGDASSRARKTSASASDYKQIFNDKRFDKVKTKVIKFRKANPAIADRLQSCTAMIKNADGRRRLFVDPRCKKLIVDLEDRVYKEGTSELDDGPFQGHITDALGYIIHTRYPYRIKTGNYQTGISLTR